MSNRFGILLVTSLMGSTAVAGRAQQAAPHDKVPERGSTVLVEGCLSGPTLSATSTSLSDETGKLSSPYTYQLRGDRNVLKRLREEHDGHIVKVTGVLKSHLPGAETHGTKIGKTSIVIGVAPGTGSPSAASSAREALPVLEVKSYEGLSTRCR
jgi:hypothetical protein